jgi:predicted RNA-binding Zn-ribbon protein involved in translation (DUF1610 family)
MNAVTRPPVGLVPRFIRLEQRNTEIYEAIQRYAEAEKTVPLAWVLELEENKSQLLQLREQLKTEPTVKKLAPLVSIKAYHIQHTNCPVCGAHTIERTMVGTLGTLSKFGTLCYESDFQDTNRAECLSCGWKGIVHDLIYALRGDN